MSVLKLIALPIIAAAWLLTGFAGAETSGATRLEGRLPDDAPLVSIQQTRGTVLDALSAIAQQAGWNLVVTAPESASSRALVIQVQKRPAHEVLDMVLEAGSLRATFTNGVLRVRPDITTAAGESERRRKPWRSGRGQRSDRVVVGQSLRIEADDVVDKAVAVGGSLTVLGHVRADAVAVGGSVTLLPGARVEGNAVAIGGTVTVEEGARLDGDNVTLGGEPVAWIIGSLTPFRAYASYVGFTWTRSLLFFVLALLIALAFPDHVARVRTFLASRPGLSSLGGIALLLGFIPLCILLAVTIIGIPLIPVAVMLLIALLFFGITVLAMWLGERIPLLKENKTPLKAVALGGVALVLVSFIPWIGKLAIFVAVVVSAGATLLSRFGRRTEIAA
jgi:hypothetical protein